MMRHLTGTVNKTLTSAPRDCPSRDRRRAIAGWGKYAETALDGGVLVFFGIAGSFGLP